MSVNQNSDDALLDPMDDSTGLAEIQKGMDEISKLKEDKQEIPQEESVHENVETEDEKEISEEENVNEPEDKKDKKTDKYRKLQNDKYRALAEKAAAVERVKELEQMLNESLNSGTYHYGKNVYSELEKAKDDKRRAIEEGDVDKLIEADISLNKAILAANDLEKWASESKTKAPVASINNEEDIYLKQEMASDWLDNHPYLQPNSRNYNSGVASKVAEFIHYLDDSLQKNNQMDIYYSSDYFNTIDDYINSIKSPKKESNISALPPVGGVRNSYSSGGRTNSSNSKTQITLNADEKRMCMNIGMPEEEWIKYKLADSGGKRL